MSVLLVPHNTLNIVILQSGFWDCGSPACTEGDSEPSASQSLRELQMFTGGLRQDPCWHVPLHQCRAAHPGWGTGSVQGNLPHFFARPLSPKPARQLTHHPHNHRETALAPGTAPGRGVLALQAQLCIIDGLSSCFA